jgi:DNA uptake protein ComE-like DNA-binding protein
MGIQDRDYTRERRQASVQSAASAQRSWVIAGILILTVLIVLALVGRRESHDAAPVASRPSIVDVNRATRHELSALPYISDAVAQAIVEGRPYSSVEDLLRVKGIGPKILDRIRPHVKVGDSMPQPQQPRTGGTPQERRAP